MTVPSKVNLKNLKIPRSAEDIQLFALNHFFIYSHAQVSSWLLFCFSIHWVPLIFLPTLFSLD